MSTIDRTVDLLAALMCGEQLERNGLTRRGMTVATADRYLRALARCPGVVEFKAGRRRFVAFSFSMALRKARGL